MTKYYIKAGVDGRKGDKNVDLETKDKCHTLLYLELYYEIVNDVNFMLRKAALSDISVCSVGLDFVIRRCLSLPLLLLCSLSKAFYCC